MISDIAADYPWLAAPWQRLMGYVEAGRMPPALLLTGVRGLGKALLAKAFAQRLLCRHGDQTGACGRCDSCRLVEAGSHPDLLIVEPEEAGRPIRIDLIRDTLGRLTLKPHFHGYRVVLIIPADAMNRHAANGVLKTLEEPDAATLFLLVTSAPESLPPTVRSRCQTTSIASPKRSELLSWLQDRSGGVADEDLCTIAQNAPLRALQLMSTDAVARWRELKGNCDDIAAGRVDPIAVAAAWERSPEDTVAWLTLWIEDLVRKRMSSARTADARANGELQGTAGQAQGAPLAWFRYLDRLAAARRSLSSHVNRQLLMEELAIHWFRTSGNLARHG